MRKKLMNTLALTAMATTITVSSASAFPEDILEVPILQWIASVVKNDSDDGAQGREAGTDGEVEVIGGGGSGQSGPGRPNASSPKG